MNNLQRAVIEQLGYDNIEDARDTLEDIANYGIGEGFSGFIYYDDTCNFFLANKEEIVERLAQDADDFGVNILTMVKDFRCVDDDTTEAEIGQTLWGDGDDTQLMNALAWYAAESVAYELAEL